MSHYMILLAIIPLSCIELTKLFHSEHKNMICGISFGLVVAPVSFSLLQYTYVPIIGKLLGLIGMAGNLIHGMLGYFCLIGSGILEPAAQLTTMQLVMVNLVNGVLFTYLYGIAGYLIDRKQARKSLASKVVFS